MEQYLINILFTCFGGIFFVEFSGYLEDKKRYPKYLSYIFSILALTAICFILIAVKSITGIGISDISIFEVIIAGLLIVVFYSFKYSSEFGILFIFAGLVVLIPAIFLAFVFYYFM